MEGTKNTGGYIENDKLQSNDWPAVSARYSCYVLVLVSVETISDYAESRHPPAIWG